MKYIDKSRVGKGAVYLYVENIALMLSGYVFWLVVSKITGPDVIGISATIVSFSAIITTVVNMAIPVSIQRFLGKTFANQSIQDSKVYVEASILLLIISILITTTFLVLIRSHLETLTKVYLDQAFLVITIFLIVGTSMSTLLRGIIIATLNTRILPLTAIVSAVLKFVLAFVLIILGTGAYGLTISVASFSVLGSLLLGFATKRMFSSAQAPSSPLKLLGSAWMLLKGGIPNWIPNLISSLGTQLGTIIVFGAHGASNAGLYFVSYSIYTAVAAGMAVIFSITYPVLSSMTDGRKKFSWRVTKLSMLISVPFSMSILLYSKPLMGLFGEGYISGSSSLEILLFSVTPVAIMTGISNLVYSYGMYREVLVIGIAASIPRTLLYFILVPHYGGSGAALSFTIGSMIGLAVSIFVSQKNNFKISWKDTIFISVIPIGISLATILLGSHYIFSICISMLCSYLALIWLRVLRVSDIEDATAVLPKTIAIPTLRIFSSVEKMIHRYSNSST
jgi:O-antigen/teichoic acid export membrane protein